MAFYESVKDDIREENSPETDEDVEEDDKVAFDQLKENADEREDPEEAEKSSSESDIEVLGDGEIEESSSPQGSEKSQTGDSEASSPVRSGDPELVDLLQSIEEQNQEMLDVLRGIKRSLE